jgi:hypothetical protein
MAEIRLVLISAIVGVAVSAPKEKELKRKRSVANSSAENLFFKCCSKSYKRLLYTKN